VPLIAPLYPAHFAASLLTVPLSALLTAPTESPLPCVGLLLLINDAPLPSALTPPVTLLSAPVACLQRAVPMECPLKDSDLVKDLLSFQ
jgi:hypothetical protein